MSETELVREEGNSTWVWAKKPPISTLPSRALYVPSTLPLQQKEVCRGCPWNTPLFRSPLGLQWAASPVAPRDGACSHLATWRFSDPLGNLWIQINQASDNPVVPSSLCLPFFPQRRPNLATRPARLAMETKGTKCILLGCRT